MSLGRVQGLRRWVILLTIAPFLAPFSEITESSVFSLLLYSNFVRIDSFICTDSNPIGITISTYSPLFVHNILWLFDSNSNSLSLPFFLCSHSSSSQTQFASNFSCSRTLIWMDTRREKNRGEEEE